MPSTEALLEPCFALIAVCRSAGRGSLLVAALIGGLGGFPSVTVAHAQVGTPVEDMELPALDGGKAHVIAEVAANVIVFVRPGQSRSLGALKEFAACRKALEGKSVRWAAIVSGAASKESVTAMVRESQVAMPLLIDEGDVLYGSLELAQHPVTVIIGADRKVAAVEPLRTINYCAIVTAHVRHVLREISDEELQHALAPPKAEAGGDAQVALRYRALAAALFKSGNYAKAIENVRRSLEKDPGRAATYVLLGDILAAQGDCAEANHAYRKAREIDPSSRASAGGVDGCTR